MRTVTHKTIVQFHKDIVRFHLGLKGFYRFNWNEITNKFRSGVPTPALLLESHSSTLERNPNRTTTFNGRDISFLVLDFTGKADNYNRQEEVLDETENIVLDIAAYISERNNDENSWLYGLLDLQSMKYEKVGPLFDQMYGWNLLYTVKNKESMIVDPRVWNFNTP